MKGKDPDKLIWKTNEGIQVKPVYFKEDRTGDTNKNVEEGDIPGKFPFTRGMYYLVLGYWMPF